MDTSPSPGSAVGLVSPFSGLLTKQDDTKLGRGLLFVISSVTEDPSIVRLKP